MNDKTFDQITIPLDRIGDTEKWLMEDHLYEILFYKGEAVNVEPPTFMDLKITDTSPGARGDTASGRVLKPAIVETGAEIQVPIFIDQDEMVKVDTRTGEYVSRSTES
jgi:elongation factor P